ncbi:hypothetical protein AVEN_123924-1 [Araneus ventricosus]|uniref:Uncharacterized protein n=1 Tax=Araneus ventricosus TaxID=182803 RepID=A0A4Y2Q437_ARAVE|nr:hypothetical protein AVEN_123924-1 [Araneus ventricosus]
MDEQPLLLAPFSPISSVNQVPHTHVLTPVTVTARQSRWRGVMETPSTPRDPTETSHSCQFRPVSTLMTSSGVECSWMVGLISVGVECPSAEVVQKFGEEGAGLGVVLLIKQRLKIRKRVFQNSPRIPSKIDIN